MRTILTLIINLLTGIISVILTPIDILISSYLPSFDSALSHITDFFNYIGSYIDFVMGWLSLPSFAINFLSAFVVFKLVIEPTILGVKLILKWYKTLKD